MTADSHTLLLHEGERSALARDLLVVDNRDSHVFGLPAGVRTA